MKQQLTVKEGLSEKAALKIICDIKTWIDILSGEQKLLFDLIRGKIKVKGKLKLMKSFSRCFSS